MLGVVLLLGIAVVGVTAVLVFGASAIGDTRDTSRTMGVEHTMAQLDAKVAMVALGDSDAQSVEFFDSGDGRYEVRPGAGWINVTHHNHSGSGGVETIVNASLGAVVYDTSDQEVAYQAGGVWRHRGNESGMVSPPEFHYRGATLTFPVIAVKGNASVAGSASVSVEALGSSRRVYPNASASYGSEPYRNPVEQGNVTVKLHSRYYQAWATYFRERTEGEVSEFHGNDTVRLTLVTPRVLGDFDMPSEGNAISLAGLSWGHAVNSFSLTLEPPVNNGGTIPRMGFNNMDWSLYADQGSQKFEIHLRSKKKQDCKNDNYNDLAMGVYYSNGTGAPHEWENTSVTPRSGDIEVVCEDLDSDGQTEPKIVVDLTGGTNLTYTDTDISNWHFDQSADSASQAPLTGHSAHGEDTTYLDGGSPNETSIDHLTNHYLALLGPNVDLVVDDNSKGRANRVSESESFGTLEYDTQGGAGFLTFLHVTENRVEVDAD